MKYVLFGLLLICMAFNSMAQQKFSFTANGQAISDKDPGYNAAQTAVGTVTLTAKQKILIKKELATRVQQAINNIQDDSLRWKALYQHLWGNTAYSDLLSELRTFRQYLTNNSGTIPQGTFTYTPSPASIESDLLNAPVFNIPPDINGTSFSSKQLIYTNPLNHYLLRQLRETMDADNINYQAMDINYINGWRELEKTLIIIDTALADIKYQLKPCTPTGDSNYQPLISTINNLLGNSSTNTVINLLQKSFFKKWIWYNKGFLLINPLSYTTTDRRYPSNEKISQLSEDDKKALLNDGKEDSLIAKLFTTRKIRNEALSLLPASKMAQKNDFYLYDAANSYAGMNEKSLPKYKDTKKGLGVIVYNVPAKEILKIRLDKSVTIQDKSSTVQNIEDGLSDASLTSILTNASTILTAFQKIGPALNGVQPSLPRNIINYNPNIGAIDAASYTSTTTDKQIKQDKQIALTKASADLTAFMGDFDIVSFKSNLDGTQTVTTKTPSKNLNPELIKTFADIEVTDREFYFIVEGRKIAVTKNSDADKINVINGSFIKPDSTCINCSNLVEKCLIDSFMNRDKCYAFYYINAQERDLQDQAQNVIYRFKCFIDAINSNRLNQRNYESDLIRLKARVRSVLSIIQRSLPPILHYDATNYFFEEEQTDTARDYRTLVFNPPLPEPPKKIVYEVYSNLPGKVIDGKNPSDSNFVITHTFKYAKRHKIDFSVGLAYTTNTYLIKSNSGSNLPQITEGDRFRPIAGMHIYPAGLLKVNDSFFPSIDRLSLFIGVGLKDALSNLYPAISYDVVPGIRLMGGVHFYKDTRYTIINNQVVDQASAFRKSGAFISFNLEPTTFVKLIGLIK